MLARSPIATKPLASLPPVIVLVPGVPLLSAATLINITTSTATPRVTLNF